MNADIRIAKAGDRQDWARLRRQLWPACPEERHRLEIEQSLAGSGAVAVASVGRELVGFVEVSVRADHVEGTTSVPVPYLEGWFVAEHFRGQGIGRALLTFAERWAIKHGYHELASDAEIGNEAAIRLHKLAGFSEVGRSVHFVKSLG
jgi:aminoglycoside 6'-N-acetyltransferase I